MRKTLLYTKRLESVGLSRDQAEAHLQILEEVIEDEMATKADIQSSKSEVLLSLSGFKADSQSKLQKAKEELWTEIRNIRSDMKTLEQRVTIKFGIMQAASITLIVALIKLF